MTMPHLTNCAHSDDGWCLECVKAEHDLREKESVDARLAILADVISFAKSMVESIPCTCTTIVSTIANMEMQRQVMCNRCMLLELRQLCTPTTIIQK